MQDNKPLVFYSCKLNSAQKNYTAGEQKLLSIVETLKEFQNILLGQKLVVQTNYFNILYSKMPSARVICWRLMLEEHSVEFVQVEGEDNMVANTMLHHLNNGNITEDVATSGQHMLYVLAHIQVHNDNKYNESTYSNLLTDKDIEDEVFLLSPKVDDCHQKKDTQLMEKAHSEDTYSMINFEGVDLISKNGKVVVPSRVQDRLVDTYHTLLQHQA